MLNDTEKQAAENFWAWFEKNRLPYEFTEEMTPEQLEVAEDTMYQALAQFSPELAPTIVRKSGAEENFKVIISAEGRRNYFNKAKELVELAPEIPGWEFVALVPPLPEGMKIRFKLGNDILDPSEMWFYLVTTEEDPRNLGVMVALKYYDQCDDDKELIADLRGVIVNLVAHILGEESFAMNIQFLEIKPLPAAPMEEGYAPLYDLPVLIDAYRQEHPSPHAD